MDNLLGKHRSRPYNPLIANAFFRAGYIESWGRGIEKIKESCIENGNDMAEYLVSPSEMMVVFHGLHDDINTQENTQENIFTVKEKRILMFCSIPQSKQEIAGGLGYKSIKSVKKEIENLLKKGYLQMTIPNQPKNRNQKYIAVYEEPQ